VHAAGEGPGTDRPGEGHQSWANEKVAPGRKGLPIHRQTGRRPQNVQGAGKPPRRDHGDGRDPFLSGLKRQGNEAGRQAAPRPTLSFHPQAPLPHPSGSGGGASTFRRAGPPSGSSSVRRRGRGRAEGRRGVPRVGRPRWQGGKGIVELEGPSGAFGPRRGHDRVRSPTRSPQLARRRTLRLRPANSNRRALGWCAARAIAGLAAVRTKGR